MRTIPARWIRVVDDLGLSEVSDKVGGAVFPQDSGLFPLSYSLESPSNLKISKSSTANSAIEEIKIDLVQKSLSLKLATEEVEKLIQEIRNIDGVQSVRIIYQNPSDLHAIIFKISLDKSLDSDESLFEDESTFEESQNIWKQAQNKVLQTRKYLREKTQEKWYFRTSLEGEFDD